MAGTGVGLVTFGGFYLAKGDKKKKRKKKRR